MYAHHVCAVLRGQKRAPYALELELIGVSCCMGEKQTRILCKAASPLNC